MKLARRELERGTLDEENNQKLESNVHPPQWQNPTPKAVSYTHLTLPTNREV